MNKCYLGLGIAMVVLGLIMLVVSISDIEIMPIIKILIGLAEIVIGISLLLITLKNANKDQRGK